MKYVFGFFVNNFNSNKIATFNTHVVFNINLLNCFRGRSLTGLMLLPNVSLEFHIFNVHIKILLPMFAKHYVLLRVFNDTHLNVMPTQQLGCICWVLGTLIYLLYLFASEYDPKPFLFEFL